MTSVVVPAHNEERVLGRLLSVLADDDELEVIVVANGCVDATAAVAAGFAGVRVLETPVASKMMALRLGDGAASSLPRVYVDADVVITAADVAELCRALDAPGVHAAGPERVLPMDGVSTAVRWYYDIWRRLPVTREELFGRGVIAVSEHGHSRLAGLLSGETTVMADDLVIAMSFDEDERVVVPTAHVEIRPPRVYADLMRRRVRAMTGNAQLARSARARPKTRRQPPRTGVRQLIDVVVREPGWMPKAALVPKTAVFLMTAVGSRVLARRAVRGRSITWLRDESSRA